MLLIAAILTDLTLWLRRRKPWMAVRLAAMLWWFLLGRRASGDTAAELERFSALTVNMSSRDGLLLYPEGTRWTAEKLARAQAIIAERQPEISPLAAGLRYVLPPRLGGTVKLLACARDCDVVLFGHYGLDGFEYISDLWSGGLIGTTVQLKFWRFPAAEVPSDRDALIRWLYARWQELDDWIAEVRGDSAPSIAAKATV